MKYGVISIVGKPNVGKSTLLNSILEKNAVIATNKPQTTRNLIEISYKDNESLINFLDTPGFHIAKNKLDHFLNSQVKKSLKKSDITLFIFDASRDYDEEDAECVKILNDFGVETAFLVVNKIDLVKEGKLDEIVKNVANKFPFKKIVNISATNNDDVKKIINIVKENINTYEGNIEDLSNMEKEVSDEFFVSEIIREIIIKTFRQEIPYGVAILIDEMKYNQETNLLSIRYSIIVEKESQKPIIIGKAGSSIKKINIELREKLSNYYDCKIFTSSEVKVKKDWRNNDLKIKELGYKK